MNTLQKQTYEGLYPLGQIVLTPGIQELLAEDPTLAHRLLTRHVQGDWGQAGRHELIRDFEITDEDREAGFAVEMEGVTRNNDGIQNLLGMEQGERIMSVYLENGSEGTFRVWVITERDRSCTTVLLPSEY